MRARSLCESTRILEPLATQPLALQVLTYSLQGRAMNQGIRTHIALEQECCTNLADESGLLR